MRHTAIFCRHSQQYMGLAKFVLPITHAYANRHGYDMVVLNDGSDPSRFGSDAWDRLADLMVVLGRYRRVLAIGCDVLIMDHARAIDERIGTDSRVTMAWERTCGSPINNDVILWTNNDHAQWYYRRLMELRTQFENAPWLLQSATNWMLDNDADFSTNIQLVEARVMNAHPDPLPACTARNPDGIPITGSGTEWRHGDFILHALTGSLEEKSNCIKRYLPLVRE